MRGQLQPTERRLYKIESSKSSDSPESDGDGNGNDNDNDDSKTSVRGLIGLNRHSCYKNFVLLLNAGLPSQALL